MITVSESTRNDVHRILATVGIFAANVWASGT